MKKIFTLAALVFASSCGPLNEGRGAADVISQYRSALGLGGKVDETPAALPPEIANAGPGEVLVVRLLSRNAVAPMVRSAQNGDAITWVSPGEVSMTFRNDILVSTRGLGDDLMGADVNGLRTAINAGSGTITRQQSYLNARDQIENYSLTCTVQSEGREDVTLLDGPSQLKKVTESCQSDRLVFKNTYWLSGNTIVKSRQVISPSQGYIEAELL